MPPGFTPPVARPMQAETAFERMTGGAAFALTKPSATADIPTEVLPAHKVLSRRSEDPTPSSPLTYREMALSVADTTSLRDAEAIARAQFEVVRNALAGAPKGKFIQLAVFDHEFTGKPKKVPIVTLAFKDWRDQEPVIAFPQRDGVATRRSSERPSTTSIAGESGRPAGFPASYPPSSIVPAAAPVVVAPPSAPPSTPIASAPAPAAPAAIAAPAVPVVPAAPEPEPESEPIKPTPVIAITDEPMLVRQVPQAQQGATLLERPQAAPADVPAPTPSQIQRDATEMAGEDERTLVKQDADMPSVPASARAPGDAAPPPAPSAEELSDSDIKVDTDVPSNVDIPPPPRAVGQPATERIPTIPPPTGASVKREPTSEPPPQVVPIPAPNRTERMAVPANPSNGAPLAKPAHLVSIDGPQPPAHASVPPPAHASVPPPAHASVPPPAHASVPPPAHASVPPAAADGNFAMRGQFPVANVPSQPPPAPDAQAQRLPSIPPSGLLPSQHPSAPPPPQASAPPAPLPQQNGGLTIKTPRGRRKGGDDLITDLFEACSDLGFIHDALEGADFVLDLVFESIPNTCTLISFFDINTREFVVVRQGVAASAADGIASVLLGRTSEFTKLVQKTMRAGRASVIPAAAETVVAEDARFRALGAEPKSFICAPIVAGGRYLGMIEVLDPLDGAPFTDGDGHALTYIGEQFAEFLSQRDLLLDPERVTRPRLSQQARR